MKLSATQHLQDGFYGSRLFSHQLCVTWDGFHDAESGIASYEVVFGRCRGCSDLLRRHVAESEHELCAKEAPMLNQSDKAFACVTARHAGHAGLTATSCSEECKEGKGRNKEEGKDIHEKEEQRKKKKGTVRKGRKRRKIGRG